MTRSVLLANDDLRATCDQLREALARVTTENKMLWAKAEPLERLLVEATELHDECFCEDIGEDNRPCWYCESMAVLGDRS